MVGLLSTTSPFLQKLLVPVLQTLEFWFLPLVVVGGGLRHSPQAKVCGRGIFRVLRMAKQTGQVAVSRVAAPPKGREGIRLPTSYNSGSGNGKGPSGGSLLSMSILTHLTQLKSCGSIPCAARLALHFAIPRC